MKALQERKSVRKGIVTFFILTVMMCCFAFGGETVHAADSDIVNIPDKNFQAVLNHALGISDIDADITKGQLQKLETINNYYDHRDGIYITDLTGIEYCTNLEKLTLFGETPLNLSKLKNLENLSFLNITIGCIDDMKNITACSNLDRLIIQNRDRDCQLKVDFSTIGNLTKLRDLEFRDIQSDNYYMLKNLTGLEEISMSVADMTVFPDLSANKNLQYMEISYCNALTDISAIKNVKSLSVLHLWRCGALTDISQLKGMTNLQTLTLEDLDITEENSAAYMSTVSSLTNLKQLIMGSCDLYNEHTSMFDNLSKLEILRIDGNYISDLTFLLKHKSILRELRLTGNPISNNNVLKQMTQLECLYLTNTRITDFSFVSQLPYLTDDSWKSYSPMETESTQRLVFPERKTSYEIKNDVKDENGNYVAPVASDNYTYNASTGLITIYPNSTYDDVNIQYNFSMTAKTGEALYVEHSKRVYFPEYIKPEIYIYKSYISTFLGEDITFETFITGNGNLEYYWYKNGNLIQRGTKDELVINDVTTDDEGTYQLMVTDGYNNAISKDIVVKVKPYTKLSGNTTVNGVSTSYISYVGELFTLNTSISGGSGGHKYYMTMTHTDTNKTETLQNYGSSNSYKGTFTSPGTKKFIVTVKDSDGNIVETNTVTVIVYEKFVGAFSIDGITEQLACEVGDTLTLTASATGGSGGYLYQMTMVNMDTNVSTSLKGYSSSNSCTIKPSFAGTFKFVVTVKDSVGKVVRINKTITVCEILKGKITINNSTTALDKIQGSSITLNANASGGSGSYTYRFSAYDEATDKWYTLKDYNTASTYTYKLSHTGNKKFLVTIKDSLGNTVVSNRILVTVKEPLSGKLTVGGSTAALTVNQGTTITLKATGSGGIGEYSYKFAAYDEASGKWYILKDFGTSSTCSYTCNYSGKKQFAVTVKDSAGNTVATNRIYVTVNDKLSGKLTVNGSTNAITAIKGNKITLNAAGFGGTGKYTYKFAVYNEENGTWSSWRDWSTAFACTVALNYPGKKQIAVTVKDSAGNTVATNRISVTINNNLSGKLTVNGSTNAITKTKGSKITLNVTAFGGTGNYTYKFAVYNEASGTWSVLKDFSTSSTYTYNLNYPGKKQIAVTVKDSSGKTVATNRITVTVTN